MRDDEIEDLILALSDDGFDPAAYGCLDEDDPPPGPPLRDVELPAAHSALTVPRSPRDFQAVVKGLHRRTTSKVLFNNPRQKFLLDAWTLAEFAIRFGNVEEVRLAGLQERWPDGYVWVGGLIKSVEATIADMPGRKMGNEYKSNDGVEWNPVEDWIARADTIPQALDTAIRKKAAKRYGSPVWLVVYLNLGEYGVRQQQTELVIAQVKQRYAQAFERLFVLWKDRVY